MAHIRMISYLSNVSSRFAPSRPHVTEINMYIDGFYLDNNPSDGVYLDDIILKDLTPSEKEELAGQDCLG